MPCLCLLWSVYAGRTEYACMRNWTSIAAVQHQARACCMAVLDVLGSNSDRVRCSVLEASRLWALYIVCCCALCRWLLILPITPVGGGVECLARGRQTTVLYRFNHHGCLPKVSTIGCRTHGNSAAQVDSLRCGRHSVTSALSLPVCPFFAADSTHRCMLVSEALATELQIEPRGLPIRHAGGGVYAKGNDSIQVGQRRRLVAVSCFAPDANLGMKEKDCSNDGSRGSFTTQSTVFGPVTPTRPPTNQSSGTSFDWLDRAPQRSIGRLPATGYVTHFPAPLGARTGIVLPQSEEKCGRRA